MDAHLSKQFWGPTALSGSSWKRWIAKPRGQSQWYLAAYLYIFLTNVELETLFSAITKGDGELDGDSLDSTWSRFERNTGKHMQRYTWPHISCTSWGKLMVKLLWNHFFCTISRMKLDKDFLSSAGWSWRFAGGLEPTRDGEILWTNNDCFLESYYCEKLKKTVSLRLD